MQCTEGNQRNLNTITVGEQMGLPLLMIGVEETLVSRSCSGAVPILLARYFRSSININPKYAVKE